MKSAMHLLIIRQKCYQSYHEVLRLPFLYSCCTCIVFLLPFCFLCLFAENLLNSVFTHYFPVLLIVYFINVLIPVISSYSLIPSLYLRFIVLKPNLTALRKTFSDVSFLRIHPYIKVEIYSVGFYQTNHYYDAFQSKYYLF